MGKNKIFLRVKLVHVWVEDHFIFQEDTEQQRNSYRNSLFGRQLEGSILGGCCWNWELPKCSTELSSQGKMRAVIKSFSGWISSDCILQQSHLEVGMQDGRIYNLPGTQTNILPVPFLLIFTTPLGRFYYIPVIDGKYIWYSVWIICFGLLNLWD